MLAPLPVSTIEPPLQTVLLPLIDTAGNALTVIVLVVTAAQLPLDPVSVYTAVDVGDTVMLPAVEPVLQV